MRVYINPGHDREYDPGAVNHNLGLREADIAAEIGDAVKCYLIPAGCEVKIRQSDNLYFDSNYADRPIAVTQEANDWPADVFVSLHCNAFNGVAKGTETCIFSLGGASEQLGQYIQRQLVSELGTIDRGLKERPGLLVLKRTIMPAVLVEIAFIDNDEDAWILTHKKYEIARAIARGVTDYELWANYQRDHQQNIRL